MKGIEDLVAAVGVVEALEVAAVGVGDDGAVAAGQGAVQEGADGGAFAGAGGADQFAGRPVNVTAVPGAAVAATVESRADGRRTRPRLR
jgi:hypothetical protein